MGQDDDLATAGGLLAAIDRAFGLLDERTRLRVHRGALAVSESRLRMLHHMQELLGIYQGALSDRTPEPETLALLVPVTAALRLLAAAIAQAERAVRNGRR